jgi:GH24 family phage-related lysozyme (muramidase)
LSVAGLTGNAAKKALANCQNVMIDYNTALNIFYQTTLPAFARRTKKVYPGVEKLPPDAQGGLLSLVYNRGESVNGSSRIEMKNIISYVAVQNLAAIAKEIRKMKRLWEGKGLPGLLDRREKEADLIEKATFNILQEDIIII